MAQLKGTTISGNLTVTGNAYFENAEQTRQELNFIGYDPGIDNTPTAWANAGTGFAYLTSGDTVGLSGYYGFIENKYNGSTAVHQTLYSIEPVATFTRMGSVSSNGWSSWHRVVDTNFSGKELWSGSWASGTVTVPNSADYVLFQIGMDGQGTSILGIRYGEHVRGIGGYSGDAGEVTTYHFTATRSGNTWTFKRCNSFKHTAGGSHGSATKRTVTTIRGLI